jgi:hypothetical protein
VSAPQGDPSGGEPSAPGPLTNRFTRATAVGCLGIAGVFALPTLLFLPLEDWHLSGWITQTIVLAAFAATAGGAWLLARVPSEGLARAVDALHPLTHAGRAPLREQPANGGNRAVLLAFWALVLVAAGGYVATGAAATRDAFGASIGVVAGVGLLCLALGGLVAVGRVPVPAWAWARRPIRPGPLPQGFAVALFGLALLGWALLGAAGKRYGWGICGLAVLVLASVLLTPLAHRWPYGHDRRPDPADGTWSGASQRDAPGR